MKDYISTAIEKIVKSIDTEDGVEGTDAMRLSQAALNLAHLQLNIDIIEKEAQDGADLAEMKDKYHELLLAVQAKIPGETRHETALRIITHAESPTERCVKA